MVQGFCNGTHLFSKISLCLQSHFILAPSFWAADDNNKKNMAPGMKANGETLLLFACGGHACLLYSCGNQDNPGRSQRSLGAPLSPSSARVDFT